MASSPVNVESRLPGTASSSVVKKVLVGLLIVVLFAAIAAGAGSIWAEQSVEQSRRTVAIAGGKCKLVRVVPWWLSVVAGDGFHTILDKTVIENVQMQGSKIGDDEVSAVLAVPNLETLAVQDCKATSACLPDIAKLKSLKSLNLSQTQVTDISALAALPALVRLDLSFSKVRDADLGSIKQFPALRSLNAGGLMVTDRGVEELAKCQQLEELSIKGATLGATALRPFHELKHLKTLVLAESILDNDDVEALKAALPGCKIEK